MSGREWSWEMTSATTTVENFMRVSVAVTGADANADPLYTLVGYLALPTSQVGGAGGGNGGGLGDEG